MCSDCKRVFGSNGHPHFDCGYDADAAEVMSANIAEYDTEQKKDRSN